MQVLLGVIFIWLGILNPFGIGPAQGLVEATVYWFPADAFVPILGWWEVAIDLCLIVRPLIRVGILLLFLSDAREGVSVGPASRGLFYQRAIRVDPRRAVHRQESGSGECCPSGRRGVRTEGPRRDDH